MGPTQKFTRRHIVFVAFDGFQLLDLAGPMQVFMTANEHARNDSSGRPVEYRISAVSHQLEEIRCVPALPLRFAPLPALLEPGTTLMVVGGNGVETASSSTALNDWLRRHANQAERICSICNGAFLLARAGLLAGRRATTHWIDCDQLQRRYPDIEVDRDAIYVRDGKIWTSAGVSAGIDLALALVEHDHGPNASAVIARRLVLYAKRPGNQSQFSEFIELIARDRAGSFAALHQWILANINADLRVPALARQAGMSERSFARKYRASVGMTPAETVARFRAHAARHHLLNSNVSLKTIAARAGFGSVEHMNRVHLKVYGLTSRALREIG